VYATLECNLIKATAERVLLLRQNKWEPAELANWQWPQVLAYVRVDRGHQTQSVPQYRDQREFFQRWRVVRVRPKTS
jgi:hypothetical protein